MSERVINSHKAAPLDNDLTITCDDEPGAGGACHLYTIKGFSTATNASDPFIGRYGSPAEHATILFQNGTIPEMGVNGVTIEALLAICIDRLECFQAGPANCNENAWALEKCREALSRLHQRTQNRRKQGVEGTDKPHNL
jgi:hypothetical protein